MEEGEEVITCISIRNSPVSGLTYRETGDQLRKLGIENIKNENTLEGCYLVNNANEASNYSFYYKGTIYKEKKLEVYLGRTYPHPECGNFKTFFFLLCIVPFHMLILRNWDHIII